MKRIFLICFFLTGFISFHNEGLLALKSQNQNFSNINLNILSDNFSQIQVHSCIMSAFFGEQNSNSMVFDVDDDLKDNKNKTKTSFDLQYSPINWFNTSKNKDQAFPRFCSLRLLNKIFILHSVFRL